MRKILLLISLVIFSFSAVHAQQGIVYITDQGGEPWTYNVNSGNDNFMSLNAAFGNGGYSTVFFQNVNVNNVFTNSNCFILMEGGAQNDVSLNNFIAANQVVIQNWVQAGGHIMIESAGWNSDVNCGFGGVVIQLQTAYNYASGTGQIAFGQNAHAIFNNATFPSGNNWTGNYFTHDIVNTPCGTNLIEAPQAQGNQYALVEYNYGSGLALFSGITYWGFHQPQPASEYLSEAIFDYMHPCAPGAGVPVGCTAYNSVPDQSIDHPCSGVVLDWDALACPPVGYNLYFGTNNPPNNIINGVNQGLNLTYNTGPLQPGTTYYWQIEPFTNAGPATGCQVWSFTTLPLPPKPNPTGPLTICANSSHSYTIDTIPHATGYTWTVPAGATIVSGQGTDSIYVSFGNAGGQVCVHADNVCGPGQDSCITIGVYPYPIVDFTSDTIDGCVPVVINFTDLSSVPGGTITQWLWDFGDGTTSSQQHPSHQYNTTGSFNVKLVATTSDGCKDSTTKISFINTYPAPKADFSFGPLPADVLNAKIFFYDQSSNAKNWYWNFGDRSNDSISLVQNPTHTYSDSGEYCVTLIVKYNSGCIDTTTRCLHIDGAYSFYVPASFSPNGDGLNDYFMPKGVNLKDAGSFEMLVYDRWGNKVYEQFDFNKPGWDGRIKGGDIGMQDIYVYRISTTDFRYRQHVYVGHIFLIR